MEQQPKQWTFLPNSICMYWIFGTHSEIYLPIMKNLSTFSPISVCPFWNCSDTFFPFKLVPPILKFLGHILPLHSEHLWGVPSAQVSCPLGTLIWGTLLSTKLPVQKIHRGWHPRKFHSGQNGHQSIRPSIQSFIHPRDVGLVRNWTAESARLQETHGWINAQLHNRERALAWDARLKPENQCASRLDAGFVRKQRGSDEAGRQAGRHSLQPWEIERERKREARSLARWSKHRAAAAASAYTKTNCTQFLQTSKKLFAKLSSRLSQLPVKPACLLVCYPLSFVWQNPEPLGFHLGRCCCRCPCLSVGYPNSLVVDDGAER